MQCAVQTPGTEGIIFSSGEERTEAAGCSREAELHSHQHQRERVKKEEDCFAQNYLQFAPQIISTEARQIKNKNTNKFLSIQRKV